MGMCGYSDHLYAREVILDHPKHCRLSALGFVVCAEYLYRIHPAKHLMVDGTGGWLETERLALEEQWYVRKSAFEHRTASAVAAEPPLDLLIVALLDYVACLAQVAMAGLEEAHHYVVALGAVWISALYGQSTEAPFQRYLAV